MLAYQLATFWALSFLAASNVEKLLPHYHSKQLFSTFIYLFPYPNTPTVTMGFLDFLTDAGLSSELSYYTNSAVNSSVAMLLNHTDMTQRSTAG